MTTEWSVEPKKLLSVMSVLDLVPCRPGIPSSVFMQIGERNGKLTTELASDVSGAVSVAGTGVLGLKKQVYLDRRLFLPFVFTAQTYKSEKPFVFQKVGKQILVHQGKRKATFDLLPSASGYGDIVSSGGTVLPMGEKLSDMLKIAADCATGDQSVPELNCVYAVRNSDGLDLYASNQLVVFRGVYRAKGKFPDRLAFPLVLVPLVTAQDVKEVRLKEREVVLQFACGVLWQGVSVKAQKGFPRKTMDALIEDGRGWPEQFRLQTRRLGAVTERFAQYLTAVRRQDWAMKLRAAEGDKQVQLEVKIPQGIFREKVTVEEPIKHAFEVDWPLDTLMPVFSYFYRLKDTVMRVLFGKDTPYLLTAGGVSIVVTRRKD